MTTATTKISALPNLSTFVDNAIIPTSVSGITYKVTGTSIANYVLGKIAPTTEFVNGDWHVRINNVGALELVNYTRDQTFGGLTPWFDDQANTWGVKVNANYDWTFQNDGKFIIPSGGDIVDSNGQSVLINTGDVTFTGSMLTTPNNTDQNWPNGYIVLAPGTTGNTQYLYNGQFLNIYPTNANDAPHIHIAAGVGLGAAKGDLMLGDDLQYVDINHQGFINVQTRDELRGQARQWEFSTDGTLYGPQMGGVAVGNAVLSANGQALNLIASNEQRSTAVVKFLDADGSAKDTFTVNYSVYTDIQGLPDLAAYNQVLWFANGSSVAITNVSIDNQATTLTITLGSSVNVLADTFYTIDWYTPTTANVVVATGNESWYFQPTGTLELPASGNIKQSNSKTKTASVYSVTTGTVIWTASENIIGSAKLLIQTECFEVNDTSGSHFQTCEAIIASRVMANGQTGYGDPIMTVYGVVHTSNLPMVTFTVQRNLTTHLIEVVATMTATADGLATVSVYSVEMASLQIGP